MLSILREPLNVDIRVDLRFIPRILPLLLLPELLLPLPLESTLIIVNLPTRSSGVSLGSFSFSSSSSIFFVMSFFAIPSLSGSNSVFWLSEGSEGSRRV